MADCKGKDFHDWEVSSVLGTIDNGEQVELMCDRCEATVTIDVPAHLIGYEDEE